MSGAGDRGERVPVRYSDRVCSPADTLARVTPLLVGSGVTRLARITGLDAIGIPVWNAMRPNARSLVVHQGKGITDLDAKVSAAMEALERAVAENPPLPTRRASIQALRADGRRADPLSGLLAAGSPEIAPDTALEWIAACDLVHGTPVWVPRAAVTLDRTRPSRYWQSSDGLASGNTAAEAIFHGVLERIERDAKCLWQLAGPAQRARTCVDVRSYADDPVVRDLLDRIEHAGFRIQLFDVTSDVGVPVFMALLAPATLRMSAAAKYIDVTHGSGAHPHPVRALIRALTEAVQSRLTLISGTRDDVAPETFARPLPPALRQELDFPVRCDHRSYAVAPAGSLTEMTAAVIGMLDRKGLGPLLAVRLNPDEDRMAVVKVLAPRLENPPGARKHPLGARALGKMLVFR
ncbi:YcaO-like family protein [Rhodobium gokarnense]|uniref:Ribosomal protein S12 methylthiotransferase accessory factor n=1 Tax=Rhodobium gokarnense TaxID=364296 RepID=A0ABT3HAE5_9HYPH|nr:YcaO-like family protein [Rhodobium gokarnense]MCW2307374.1 ribosomal protein S12 methylthiotransferase accessory factor [Rhodobium gokarnense]